MTETLFVFDERNYLDCQKSFRGAKNQEYYLGDYSIEAGSVINVRADRKEVGVYSIISLTSKTRLFFRRSWPHIRQDGTDVTILWFVKRGRLCISHQGGYGVAKAGEFTVTKSTAPFFMECQTDDDGQMEVLHVIVPTLVLRRFLPHDVKVGFSMPAQGADFALADHMFSYVFEDQGDLDEETALNVVENGLSVLSHSLRDREICGPVRQTVSDKRLHDILRYIEIHLSDPKLSIATVAEGCGVSSRYLSFLLKLHGTPFSTLVWEKRLQMASRWLSSTKQDDISVGEIAYNVGFKSPAHFSRMFKRVFKLSPSEYRSANVAEIEASQH